uniref:Uncharacterized protein n=1 Tax=Proboscia inermis TaxID=420281 RepID=A0A6T8G2J5_9STRA|mmetsp:Transcript_14552/g.14748  ORF Transcript_14552/g.14748 Transcript_14552/m.14748 type:complete len:100 (+) Transcript_14552:315-614(+)
MRAFNAQAVYKATDVCTEYCIITKMYAINFYIWLLCMRQRNWVTILKIAIECSAAEPTYPIFYKSFSFQKVAIASFVELAANCNNINERTSASMRSLTP